MYIMGIQYISYLYIMATLTDKKVKMNFTIRKGLKDEFFKLAEEMETTPSNLFNMLAKQAVRTRTLHISFSPEENEDIGVPHPIAYEDLTEKEKKSYNNFLKNKDTMKFYNLRPEEYGV
ncbi:hypothetical protein CSB09_00900 [Candidatus Gracilibacteria bacterium]|nr:MAG: hypothetical protein CSB09_00900 [Candidatus Gracilibacteria bacterium]